MESNFGIFQEITNQPTGIKRVDKLATSLAKGFKPTQAGALENANDLAFWLFVYGQNELARRVCQALSTIPFGLKKIIAMVIYIAMEFLSFRISLDFENKSLIKKPSLFRPLLESKN